MRITLALAKKCIVTGDAEKWVPHKLYFGHGRGKKNLWGPRRQNYYWTRKFNYLWRLNGKRPVLLSNEELAPDAVIHDANELARVNLYHTSVPEVQIGNPFPFTKKFIPKSQEDPEYKTMPALLYNTHFTLYEGVKGANHFTHSIVEEESLPSPLKQIEDALPEIDEKFANMLEKRLHHATVGESSMQMMPRLRDFPRLNWGKVRSAGIHPFRRDTSILKALTDVSEAYISSQFGLNALHQIHWPACLVPVEREGALCVLDLKADFVTTSRAASFTTIEAGSGEKTPSHRFSLITSSLPVFSFDANSTESKDLPDIHPVDWRINLDETNLYPNNYNFAIPRPYNINSIFLSNNTVNPKMQPDRMVFARGMLYCYGYLLAQVRRAQNLSIEATGEEHLKVLSNPQMIQLAFYNATKSNVGFIRFQLNTSSFTSSMKNQVWLDGPYPLDNQTLLLKKFVALNLLSQGYTNKAAST